MSSFDPSTLSNKSNTQKVESLSSTLSSLFKNKDETNLNIVLKFLLDESKCSVLVSRPVLQSVPDLIKSNSNKDDSESLLFLVYEAVSPFSEYFSQACWLIGDALAYSQQVSGNLADSAKTLKKLPLKSIVANDKPKAFLIYLRICRLFLEEDDADNAEIYLTRANHLSEYATAQQKKSLTLSFARVQDLHGQYLVAARKYYDLSFLLSNTEDRMDSLTHSITCAILGKVGAIRSRIMALLIKDDRVKDIDIYPVLRDIVYRRILTSDLVQMFDSTLYAHQREELDTGYTVLQTAVMEHNILAASQIYTSIHLSQLSNILNISKPNTMKLVAKMIMGKRLEASIDQIDEIITFASESEETIAVTGAGDRKATSTILEELDDIEDHAGPILLDWDSSIATVLHKIDSVAMSLS